MRKVTDEGTVVVTNHNQVTFYSQLACVEIVLSMDIEHLSRDLNSCPSHERLQHLRPKVRPDRDEERAAGIPNTEKCSSRGSGCVR
jgi:hypothetical protein